MQFSIGDRVRCTNMQGATDDYKGHIGRSGVITMFNPSGTFDYGVMLDDDINDHTFFHESELELATDLIDADELNTALTSVDSYTTKFGSDTILTHLLQEHQLATADGKHTKCKLLLDVKDLGWIQQGPLAIIPALWPIVLRENGKMMTFAFALAGLADNNGQIQELKMDKFAENLGFRESQCYSYLLNLVGMGLVTILDPAKDVKGQKKLYHNLQLHAIPAGMVWPPVQVEATPTPDSEEGQQDAA